MAYNPFNIFRWSNTRIIINAIIFLIFIPFRLPITVLLIKLFNSLSTIGETLLDTETISINISVTKLIINLLLGTLFVYNIEHISRYILNRKASSGSCNMVEDFYWWTIVILILTIAYIIFDIISLQSIIPQVI